jgi:hypothetical protein
MAIDTETAELIQILRNSTRTPGSVFDRAAGKLTELSADRDHLLGLTARLTDHPEDYDGPCGCRECRGHAAEGDPGEKTGTAMA